MITKIRPMLVVCPCASMRLSWLIAGTIQTVIDLESEITKCSHSEQGPAYRMTRHDTVGDALGSMIFGASDLSEDLPHD